MAVNSLYTLKTQPVSLETVIPALGNMVPLALFGAAGTIQLLGAFLRLIRIMLAVPVVLGGAYLTIPSSPDLLHKNPELIGGGLFALLATPEVIEAIVLIALISGAIIWFSKQLIALVSRLAPTTTEDD